jgi:hypothetical protein
VGAETRYRVRRARLAVGDDLLAVDAALAHGATRILQTGERTTVAAVTNGGADLVLKRFHERTLARVLETLALGSGAARVWKGAAVLRAAGFEAPEIVAVLERPRAGVPVWSCAVMRYVAGPSLDALWRARAGAARRRLTLAFADYLRRLHAAGIYSQDLRGANVLVPCEDPARFVLVDLDRVRRYRRLSWRRRRKNLAQVHRSVGRGAPLGEGIRFLHRYLGTPPACDVRRAGADILRLAERKDAEYARRRSAAAAAGARSG